MKCCLECDNEKFLEFESSDLGSRRYPICYLHIMEFSVSQEKMQELKARLSTVVQESRVVPPAPQPEPEPQDEDDDDWEPEL